MSGILRGSSLIFRRLVASSFRDKSGKGQLSALRTWTCTTVPYCTWGLSHISWNLPGFSFRYWEPFSFSRCCRKYWWPTVSFFRESFGLLPLWLASKRIAVLSWVNNPSGRLECSLTWKLNWEHIFETIGTVKHSVRLKYLCKVPKYQTRFQVKIATEWKSESALWGNTQWWRIKQMWPLWLCIYLG